MKKGFSILFLFITATTFCFSQNVFQKISYNQALHKAQKNNKLVFLFYEFSDCMRCNEAINEGVNKKEIIQKLNKWYIPININAINKERQTIQQDLNIIAPSALLVLDGTGNIVFQSDYGDMISLDSIINEGIKRKKSLDFLKKSEKEYFESHNKNLALLSRLIEANTNLGQDTKLLLTEYISLLPKDSIHSYKVLQFIARQSPIFETNADNILRGDSNFNDAWYTIPVEERISINQKMIKKSTKRAIASKDDQYLNRIVEFARGTYYDEQGKKYVERLILMDYYWQVGDTSKYLSIADAFNNKYLDIINDLAVKYDSVLTATDTTLPSALQTLKQPTAVNYNTKWYAQYLFNSANFFYHVDKDKKYLKDAMNWCAASLKLDPFYTRKHLYALLLYKIGERDSAIKYETEAINESRSSHETYTKSWPTILKKMKNGEALIPGLN